MTERIKMTGRIFVSAMCVCVPFPLRYTENYVYNMLFPLSAYSRSSFWFSSSSSLRGYFFLLLLLLLSLKLFGLIWIMKIHCAFYILCVSFFFFVKRTEKKHKKKWDDFTKDDNVNAKKASAKSECDVLDLDRTHALCVCFWQKKRKRRKEEKKEKQQS